VAEIILKTCCTCKKDLPEDSYTQGEWSKVSTKRCRSCVKIKNEKTSSRNKQAKAEYQKRYWQENKERLKVENTKRYRANKEKYRPARERWLIENRDRINAEHSANKEKHSYISWVQRLRRVYGITVEDYDAMLSAQNFSCFICKTTDPGAVGNRDSGRKVFAVDHCHESGKIRGLLCHRCNKGLGHFLDDRENLMRAADYIKDCH
jgi:hypothetical protein